MDTSSLYLPSSHGPRATTLPETWARIDKFPNTWAYHWGCDVFLFPDHRIQNGDLTSASWNHTVGWTGPVCDCIDLLGTCIRTANPDGASAYADSYLW